MDDKDKNCGKKYKEYKKVDADQEKDVKITGVKVTIPQGDSVTVSAKDISEKYGKVSKPKSILKRSDDSETPIIEKHAEFTSFVQLRDTIEKYQKENSVQLIVKDSKLLRAESTKKIIPKVYHLVNHELLYHSITYTCKCHGELRQRPGTRMKNVGRKRLNCPMYIRFKLTPDCQRLVLFDLHEEHNHGIDKNTCQMAPRQQIYHLSRLKRKRSSVEDEDSEFSLNIDLKDSYKSENDNETPTTAKCLQPDTGSEHLTTNKNSESESLDVSHQNHSQKATADRGRAESPLDSSSNSSCSDSEEEEIRNNRRLLPFPVRLIGSAITSNPELIASAKELLEIQKSKLRLEKQKLLMETKILELQNTKLELEVKQLRKTLSSGGQTHDTTIFLQAP